MPSYHTILTLNLSFQLQIQVLSLDLAQARAEVILMIETTFILSDCFVIHIPALSLSLSFVLSGAASIAKRATSSK
jgi:hypothetical protein